MALEDTLRELNETVALNNDLLKQVLGSAGKTTAKTKGDDEGGETTTRTRRRSSKTDDAEDGAGKGKAKAKTTEDLVELVTGWLSEVPVDVDDDNEPVDNEENMKAFNKRNNRKKFVKKCLGKVSAEKVSEVTDPKDVAKVYDWIMQKKDGTDPFESDET